MVAIRLSRKGTKGKPFYHIVVVDHEKPRESDYIELLGYYNPLTKPAEVKMDLNKFQAWIKKGAKPSDTVKSLIKLVKTAS
jgi:small subunit ribosomal protein S16